MAHAFNTSLMHKTHLAASAKKYKAHLGPRSDPRVGRALTHPWPRGYDISTRARRIGPEAPGTKWAHLGPGRPTLGPSTVCEHRQPATRLNECARADLGGGCGALPCSRSADTGDHQKIQQSFHDHYLNPMASRIDSENNKTSIAHAHPRSEASRTVHRDRQGRARLTSRGCRSIGPGGGEWRSAQWSSGAVRSQGSGPVLCRARDGRHLQVCKKSENRDHSHHEPGIPLLVISPD